MRISLENLYVDIGTERVKFKMMGMLLNVVHGQVQKS